MNSLLIRHGRPDDAETCAAILNAWIDETPWMPRVHPSADVARHLDEVFQAQRVLIAEHERQTAGYLSLSRDGMVTALYLCPRERGMGTGRRLLNHAKHERPQGLTLWAFQHNLAARRFYAREGFREARRTDGDNEERLPDILFAWTPGR